MLNTFIYTYDFFIYVSFVDYLRLIYLIFSSIFFYNYSYIRSVGMVDQISDRKFLEAAKATGDATLFYSVFKFFKQRNLHLCNATTFTKGERYQPYIQHYRYLFEGIDNDCNSDTNSNVTTIS